jgi:hypothetical protein
MEERLSGCGRMLLFLVVGAEVRLMTMLSVRAVVGFAVFALGGSMVAQQQAAMHAPDGGTRQRVESVVIPPTPNAPFSAVVTTEWTRIMPDGSKQTMKNHRTIARDSMGRVFEERRFFSPDGDKRETQLSELDYRDPSRHELVVCMTFQKTCRVSRYEQPGTVAMEKVGPPSNGRDDVTTEDLGRKTIGDVEVVGSREVTTISAGTMGYEKAQPIVKEFWYAPQLGINVTTKRFDPRASAIQDFEVGNIRLAEPEEKMFEPPAEYRVVRMDPQ